MIMKDVKQPKFIHLQGNRRLEKEKLKSGIKQQGGYGMRIMQKGH
jgi:hypothetical protein